MPAAIVQPCWTCRVYQWTLLQPLLPTAPSFNPASNANAHTPYTPISAPSLFTSHLLCWQLWSIQLSGPTRLSNSAHSHSSQNIDTCAGPKTRRGLSQHLWCSSQSGCFVDLGQQRKVEARTLKIFADEHMSYTNITIHRKLKAAWHLISVIDGPAYSFTQRKHVTDQTLFSSAAETQSQSFCILKVGLLPLIALFTTCMRILISIYTHTACAWSALTERVYWAGQWSRTCFQVTLSWFGIKAFHINSSFISVS